MIHFYNCEKHTRQKSIVDIHLYKEEDIRKFVFPSDSWLLPPLPNNYGNGHVHSSLVTTRYDLPSPVLIVLVEQDVAATRNGAHIKPVSKPSSTPHIKL